MMHISKMHVSLMHASLMHVSMMRYLLVTDKRMEKSILGEEMDRIIGLDPKKCFKLLVTSRLKLKEIVCMF